MYSVSMAGLVAILAIALTVSVVGISIVIVVVAVLCRRCRARRRTAPITMRDTGGVEQPGVVVAWQRGQTAGPHPSFQSHPPSQSYPPPHCYPPQQPYPPPQVFKPPNEPADRPPLYEMVIEQEHGHPTQVDVHRPPQLHGYGPAAGGGYPSQG